MTKKIKDQIAKTIRKSAKVSTKKKNKIQPIDWYAKAAAVISISKTNEQQSPLRSE